MTLKFNLADDNNKDTGKKVKKMKKRRKELDKKVTKGKLIDTHYKKKKRKRKPEDNNKSNLNAKKKMKTKESDITICYDESFDSTTSSTPFTDTRVIFFKCLVNQHSV